MYWRHGSLAPAEAALQTGPTKQLHGSESHGTINFGDADIIIFRLRSISCLAPNRKTLLGRVLDGVCVCMCVCGGCAVQEVMTGSPAEIAGFVPHDTFLLGTEDTHFNGV